MSGVGLVVDLSGIDRLGKRLERLARIDRRPLLDDIGAAVETQARRRIEEEKEGPQGEVWPEWSERYEKTRHANHRLLESEGDLMDSIGYAIYLDGSGVEVGSNLVYAATHQFGDEDRNIPARPYLGLSDDNMAELEDIVDRFIDRTVNL